MKPTNLIWERQSLGDGWTLYGKLEGTDAAAFGIVTSKDGVFTASTVNGDHQGKGGVVTECGKFLTLEAAKAAVEAEVNKL